MTHILLLGVKWKLGRKIKFDIGKTTFYEGNLCKIKNTEFCAEVKKESRNFLKKLKKIMDEVDL